MKLSWLIPQEKRFFDLLEQYAELVRRSAAQLMDLFDHFEQREEMWREIKEIERKGDDLLHTIVEELNATFVTPIEREDIYALGSGMDDILDFTEGTAERIMIFKIAQPTDRLVDLADILFQAAKELASAMPMLRNTAKWPEMKKHYIEINRLENRGDEVMRQSLVELFESRDPIEIIKLKEIYEFVEEAIDHVEDVAVILENMIVKSG